MYFVPSRLSSIERRAWVAAECSALASKAKQATPTIRANTATTILGPPRMLTPSNEITPKYHILIFYRWTPIEDDFVLGSYLVRNLLFSWQLAVSAVRLS